MLLDANTAMTDGLALAASTSAVALNNDRTTGTHATTNGVESEYRGATAAGQQVSKVLDLRDANHTMGSGNQVYLIVQMSDTRDNGTYAVDVLTSDTKNFLTSSNAANETVVATLTFDDDVVGSQFRDFRLPNSLKRYICLKYKTGASGTANTYAHVSQETADQGAGVQNLTVKGRDTDKAIGRAIVG